MQKKRNAFWWQRQQPSIRRRLLSHSARRPSAPSSQCMAHLHSPPLPLPLLSCLSPPTLTMHLFLLLHLLLLLLQILLILLSFHRLHAHHALFVLPLRHQISSLRLSDWLLLNLACFVLP